MKTWSSIAAVSTVGVAGVLAWAALAQPAMREVSGDPLVLTSTPTLSAFEWTTPRSPTDAVPKSVAPSYRTSMLSLESSRFAAREATNSLYVTEVRDNPGTMCALVVTAPPNSLSEATCFSRDWVASGRALIQSQLTPNGPVAQPRTWFILVPDGVRAVVAADGQVASVKNNVASWLRRDGELAAPLRFVHTDGSSVEVDPFGS